MILDQDAIRTLIPHAGGMCLIERVLAWDAVQIQCETNSHRAADLPLREAGRLAAICAIEYGAQAMAIHGGLLAQAAGEPVGQGGYLAAVRGVHLHRDTLHDIKHPLRIHASRLGGAGGSFIYAIRVEAGGEPVAEARVTVMTQPGEYHP